MEIKKYKFKDGMRWKADANEVGKTIDSIKDENDGAITPQLLVENAINENSPLHNCFDWDDHTAADKYRLHQARMLLGSIMVEILFEEPQEVRAYVNISSNPDTQAYYSIADVNGDKTKMAMVIADAKRRLKNIAAQIKVYEKLKQTAVKIDVLAEELCES